MDKYYKKGRKINSDNMHPLTSKDLGYAALAIAIFENLSPDKAKEALYRRFKGQI